MVEAPILRAADIESAARSIESHIERTPLWVSGPMSDRAGATVVVKAEHTQRTGSFKLRGALNAVLNLGEAARTGGVVTASTGNHGIAIATAAATAEVPATVYVPNGASPAKLDAIAARGARLVTVDSSDPYQAEAAARAAVASGPGHYVSPYNDRHVMAGQGTIGLELIEDLAAAGLGRPDAVVVAVGGGGLISGVATAVTDRSPSTTVIGASPEVDAAMVASVEAGRVVEVDAGPTFSDGTAGGLEPGSVTLGPCRDLVDEWLTVSEVAIAGAVAKMVDDHRTIVEGAAGVALAAAERWATAHPGSTVVVVTCGSNIMASALGRLLVAAGS